MDKKEQQSIDFLRSIYQDKPLNLGFSGGKDSVVILDLAERAGIVYDAIYANTTVDPPGTINFIKKNYPQVQIMHPKKSFFKLIEEKGFPSRLRRFCCEELKERYGKEYKRTSIRTYLFRLEDKEYLKVDKRGRNAYVYPIISEKEYRKEKAEDILDNWFDGSAKELFTALSEKIPKSEKERLKGVLDDMDFI